MSFFSNAVRLIGGKKVENSEEVLMNSDIPEQNVKFNFSFRNYVKESFSVLIERPLSGCVMKIMRVTSLLITGIVSGTLVALLCCIIFMQFGSVENTVLSSFVQSKFGKIFPNLDLSMKSAALRWDSKAGAVEIVMNKVRIDDFLIPRVLILPDYKKSFDQQKLIVKSVSILSPKINVSMENDFRKISLNPNFEKGGSNKSLFEPLDTFSNFGRLLDSGASVKLVGADVSISESGVDWDLKNLYCEYKVGESFPKTIDCSTSFPGQRYVSNISLVKSEVNGKSNYDIRVDSINPGALSEVLAKRNTPVDNRIFSMINGHNLPVSGTLKL
ncbi:MAG: hypothetical protein LBJ71_04805, partial [Holosporaceae bacterium]|nr:hypothetical protein [Holosporaceae bacterium]